MNILLVEDERPLSDALCKILKKESMLVDPVYTGTDGYEYARTGKYDAMILDVMLPEMNGFEVLRKIRKEGIYTPVCMLTARGELTDRVHGLESGADYYLTKPFHSEELIACLHTIMRRKENKPVMELSFGNIRLDPSSATVFCDSNGKSVKLTSREYQLLEILIRNPRQIVGKETLFERVWGYDSDADISSVEVYLSFLRKKLAFIESDAVIRASRGMGYSLEEKA
ncbi:MAG: response regulator transcription factor [Clostridia bacterium]|nr:response regulator transcription factor [Clostridia bacterium]